MRSTVTAALLCLLPLAAQADEITVETAAGPVAVAQGPKTVVALDLPAVDSLTAMGVTLAGVPKITPPAYLAPAMDGLPTVGTLFEPDFEALAVMAPDLIIAGGRSQAQVEALSRVAPTLDMTIDGLSLIEEGRERVETYGRIFGLEGKASELLETLDKKFEAAAEAAEGKGDALIILTNGNKVSAYGAGSRFGWIHSALGVPEAHEGIEVEGHGQAVSFEFIGDTNPDWIFVIDRGAAIGQEGQSAAVTLDNPLVQGTKAGQKGHIVYLDAGAMYLAGGGIQSMDKLLDQITDAFDNAAS